MIDPHREVAPRFKTEKTAKKRRTVATSPALAKQKATQIHSLIVRSGGVCANCNYECPCVEQWPRHQVQAICKLQAAHVISRKYGHTRTDERNAIALCAACHRHFTLWPIEFSEFVLAKLGLELYAELQTKSQQTTKVNWTAELERLQRLWIAIGGTP